jgi:hypothetical protein
VEKTLNIHQLHVSPSPSSPPTRGGETSCRTVSFGLFQIMKRRKVDEILLPYEDGVPLDPSVKIGDRIITAIELMVGKNLKQIAVVRNQRPVGMVRLEDAFKKIGLTKTEEPARRSQ